MKTMFEKLSCAKRELALRKAFYPKWIKADKMTQSAADHEIECMEEIVTMIEKMKLLNEVVDELRAHPPSSWGQTPSAN